jgi:Holliday junction resolvase RusA-like endonuclease
VPGDAQTAGSKGAFKHPTTGKIIVTESSKGEAGARKKGWRADLREGCERAMALGSRPPFGKEDPIQFTMVVVRARAGGHYGTGRNAGTLKDWARYALPTQRPDVLKHARAAEDALKGIAYHDDSSIVEERLWKVYSDQAGLPQGFEGTAIIIRPATLLDLPQRLVARSMQGVPGAGQED